MPERPRNHRITAALAYLLFALVVGIVVAAIWLTTK